MTADEIRRKFLDFFVSKGHKEIPSDTVVPKDDPTVLFTTAGMQQFKRQFLGQIDDYRRATTSQKCLRTDDLDKIGKTPVHHTFFEMLGNFSFGDYFKKDAIAWAWEFFTAVLKIPAEKLWVSVYEEDDEAYAIWLNTIKIPGKKILKLGDKDNFWPAEAKSKGPNGPCGPCSEIFFDYGKNANCNKGDACDPTCNCGRFAEVWNLVFTQFNRKEGGVLEPLPGKNIDTGMGLERLAAVVQGKKNNYETDLFAPIIEQVEKYFSQKKCKLDHIEKCVIADHLRAITFGISDGVMPSNEGRGYVIKKLIVDSCDIGLKKGIKEPFMCRFVSTVADIMKQPYPELHRKQNDISVIIQKVEETYIKLRNEKIPKLQEESKHIFEQNIPIEEKIDKLSKLGFFYRDTHGLTIPAVLASTASAIPINQMQQIKISEKIDEQMEKLQREKSRAASKMTGDVFAGTEINLANLPKTKFTGYDHNEGTGKILRLFDAKNKEVSQVSEGDSVIVILDETPFYAESGGQTGDIGTITHGGNIIEVTDTQKTADVFRHYGTVKKGTFKNGDSVTTKIDSSRRLSIMRNHTATHLLQSALRQVLGKHVQQQGSLVAEDRLRFDFTHPKAVSKDEIGKIETLINGYIKANDRIEKHVMPLEEAKKSGALAFFAEKYGETVRVVEIDGYSKEFCGGTHLNNTNEIGSFKITGEGAIAQGIRRIEAVTGTFVSEWLKGKETEEEARQHALEQKQMEKEQAQKNFEIIKNSIDTIIKESKSIGAVNVVRHRFKDIDVETLRKISDLIKLKVKSAVIALACEHNGSANLLIVVTDDLVKKEIRANELIKEAASVMNASGGGRPQMAQAGGKDVANLEKALTRIENLIKEKI